MIGQENWLVSLPTFCNETLLKERLQQVELTTEDTNWTFLLSSPEAGSEILESFHIERISYGHLPLDSGAYIKQFSSLQRLSLVPRAPSLQCHSDAITWRPSERRKWEWIEV